jgi:nucleoid DNA-binding protein
MHSSRKTKLAADIAKATGVEESAVSKVLAELANQAYANAGTGFVLPGFGKFRVVRGVDTTGKNPFTGKPIVFRAPPEIEFTIDTAAKRSFLAGKAESSESTSDATNAPKLQPIRLQPNADDLDAAGIEGNAPYKFKVGGEPDWIQDAEVPVCCDDAILFYGQLDSLDNGDYCIGDKGMLYVFLCRSCASSRSILQGF